MCIRDSHAADITTETVEYKKNADLYEREAMDFVNTLTEEELIDLAAGDPGKAQGGNLGAAGISVPGSAGETHRCAVDKGLASIVLADGPAGLRLMKYYHVNEGSIVSMPFEFSLEGGLFYDDSRELPGERYYQYCTAIPVGTLLAQTWNPDSYTHLDVYKRQAVQAVSDKWIEIPIESISLWNCETPYLYYFEVKLGDDRAISYFAMRKFRCV